MQKLPTFNSQNHEFTYFTVMAVKNASAIQAIENRLNIMTEAVNELIDRLTDKDSNIDLEAFKSIFLSELAALLDQDNEFEFSNRLIDLLRTERASLTDSFGLLDLQFQALTERVSKIESALGYVKVEQTESPTSLNH